MRKTGMMVCKLVGRGGDKGRIIARLLNRVELGDTPTATDVELPVATTFFKNLGAFDLSPPFEFSWYTLVESPNDLATEST